jgi:hypothetical protein
MIYGDLIFQLILGNKYMLINKKVKYLKLDVVTLVLSITVRCYYLEVFMTSLKS